MTDTERWAAIGRAIESGYHASPESRPLPDALPAYWAYPPARREARLEEFIPTHRAHPATGEPGGEE